MECTVRWHGEGMAFIAETESHHLVAMDGAPEGGGRNLAPRPMELVLAGTGGCTAYDVVLILKRSRQEITSCELKLSAERANTDPKVFTKIQMHFIVHGTNLNPSLVDNAVRLSREKYCSASKMLEKTAAITADFEIVET
ncbi:MAG TPA: OsmC family protein [Burkholderiales bacterium]|nr:OsmC family protein [Burkholderiales bacterium]